MLIYNLEKNSTKILYLLIFSTSDIICCLIILRKNLQDFITLVFFFVTFACTLIITNLTKKHKTILLINFLNIANTVKILQMNPTVFTANKYFNMLSLRAASYKLKLFKKLESINDFNHNSNSFTFLHLNFTLIFFIYKAVA